jgi:hypothetical protein
MVITNMAMTTTIITIITIIMVIMIMTVLALMAMLRHGHLTGHLAT